MKKITKIEEGKRNKDRVNIYVEEEFYLACSKYCLLKYKLEVGKEVDTKYLDEVIKEDNLNNCKNYSLKVLERGMKTEKEIKDKLILKGYDEEDIEKVIIFLKEYAFVDDHKYVTYYIDSFKSTKSKKNIKYSLINKGVLEEVIEKYIDKIQDEDEFEKAKALGIKKLNTLKNKEKIEKKKKIGDMLFRKGYDYEIIKKVLKLVLDDKEIEYIE